MRLGEIEFLAMNNPIRRWVQKHVEFRLLKKHLDKHCIDLEVVFTNSKLKCFVFDDDTLIGVGRALADGRDCSYICDVAIHPKYQGLGLGKQIVVNLVGQSRGHRKIILYANPGKEGFYAKLGFKKMNTAMAIFQHEEAMINNGTISKI